MPKLPVLRAKKVIGALIGAGFYIHHQSGSHAQLRHSAKLYLRVTIPRHDKFDLPPFVLMSILKQAEMTKEEFLKLL